MYLFWLFVNHLSSFPDNLPIWCIYTHHRMVIGIWKYWLIQGFKSNSNAGSLVTWRSRSPRVHWAPRPSGRLPLARLGRYENGRELLILLGKTEIAIYCRKTSYNTVVLARIIYEHWIKWRCNCIVLLKF